MLGIALADCGALSPAAALVLGAAALLGGGLAARRPRVRAAAAALAAAAAGALALGQQLEAASRAPLSEPAERTLEATLQSVSAGPRGYRIDLVDAVAVGAGDPPIAERIRLYGEPTPAALSAIERRLPGERIRARVRLREPRELRNPGARSRLRDLARAGIGAQGWLVHPALHVRLPDREAARPLAPLYARRAEWSERMGSAGPGAPLLRALALGERGALPVSLRDAFARLGIAHILAVSGLHLALVAALVFAAARSSLGRSAFLAARWDTRLFALGLGAAAALGYALLSGWGIPVRRALVLLLGLAFAVAGGRPRALLPPLAAAAVVVLAREPQALFQPGAQLSFAASVALAAAARRGPSLSSPPRRVGGVKRRAAEMLRASATAVAVTAPLVAIHLGRVAPFALAANLLAIPWTACVLLPAAGVALLGAALPHGAASETLLAGAGAAAHATAVAAEWLAAWLPAPPAVGPLGVPGWLAVGVLAAFSFAAARTRTRVLLALAVTAVIAFAPPAAIAPAPPRLIVLDVGQGDAAVVQSGDAAVLIDGGTAIPGRSDLGARAVVPALAALGIRRLDLAVVTHGDLDHRGGIPAVLRRLPVAEVWLPHGGSGSGRFDAVLAAARARGVPLRERGAGSAPAAVGGLLVTPLWPPPGAAPASHNNRSLVVRIDAAGRRVLLPGDLEASAEAALLASGADLRADVIKLAHHGSRTSSSAAFLAAVDAAVAVVSAPCGGRFGMPHPEVLRRTRAHALSVWWTGRDGAVLVGLGGPFTAFGFADPVAPVPRACRGVVPHAAGVAAPGSAHPGAARVRGEDHSDGPQVAFAEHAVHHVADGQAVLDVDHAHRAAPSRPPQGAVVDAERGVRGVQAVADPQLEVASGDAVDTVGLDLEGALDRRRRQQGAAAGATAVGEGGRGQRKRAGVAVRVRGGELGSTPGGGVDERGASDTAGFFEGPELGIWRGVGQGVEGGDVGHPVELAVVEPDVKVQAEGPCHLVAEEAAEAAAVDAPDQLPEEVALGLGVVPGPLARGPSRRLGGEAAATCIQVEDGEVVDRLVEHGQTRGVAQHVANEDTLLPVGRELQPVVRHRGVERHGAAVVEHQHAQRADHLGRGPHVDEGVPFPRHAPGQIPVAAPQVDHQLALDGHRAAGPEITLGEVLDERVADGVEARVAAPIDLGVGAGHGAHARPPGGGSSIW
jgi:competence protein ComEC